MNYSMRIMKTERTASPQGRHETFRILLVILGVGLLTLWTYWQILFFFSGLSPLQDVSNGADIIAGIVVALWLACFFPALGLGLGLYAFTHRLPRNTPLSVTRPMKVNRTMTDTQTYVMLLTAICLFLVNYRILPIFPLINYGSYRFSELLIALPKGASNVWKGVPNLWEGAINMRGGMTVLKQHALTGALGVLVVFLQAWLVLQKKGVSRRNLGLLAASLLVVGLVIPWSGCLGLLPMSRVTVAERKEIQLSPEILEQYVGTYELEPGVDMTITREDGQLFAQIAGQQKFPLSLEKDDGLFVKMLDSQREYTRDDKGVVPYVIIQQGPVLIKAPRKP